MRDKTAPPFPPDPNRGIKWLVGIAASLVIVVMGYLIVEEVWNAAQHERRVACAERGGFWRDGDCWTIDISVGTPSAGGSVPVPQYPPPSYYPNELGCERAGYRWHKSSLAGFSGWCS